MKKRYANKRDEGDKEKTPRRCRFCGTVASLVWVHGHGQCANCGINAEECCQGSPDAYSGCTDTAMEELKK